jgi:hypothetical protein
MAWSAVQERVCGVIVLTNEPWVVDVLLRVAAQKEGPRWALFASHGDASRNLLPGSHRKENKHCA